MSDSAIFTDNDALDAIIDCHYLLCANLFHMSKEQERDPSVYITSEGEPMEPVTATVFRLGEVIQYLRDK